MRFRVVSPQSPPLHTVEFPGANFAPPEEKQASSAAMTATAQEMHRPILNAEYQNTVVL